MALDWKVISQRNWIKALQATFARFSQPQGIITRLSNLLYDVRGGFRTTDGSRMVTQYNGAYESTDGPILDILLYGCPGKQPGYLGLQKTQKFPLGLVTNITLTPIQVGGTITSATRASGTTIIVLSGAHNFVANTAPLSQIMQSGVSDASFDVTLRFNQITIISGTSYSYSDMQPDASGTGGTVGTGMTSGQVVQYDVTASDAQGGETPGSGLTVTATITSPNNAVQIGWDAVGNALGYMVYGRSNTGGVWDGALNGPGPVPDSIVGALLYVDLGAQPSSSGVYPPTTTPTINTTQAVALWAMTAPSYGLPPLAVLPAAFFPVGGGIPGATTPDQLTLFAPPGETGISIVSIITTDVLPSPSVGFSTLTFTLSLPAVPPQEFSVSGNSESLFNRLFYYPTVLSPTTFKVAYYSRTALTGTGGTIDAFTGDTVADQTPTPQGGIIGALSPVPVGLQFAEKAIFALGNGYAPQELNCALIRTAQTTDTPVILGIFSSTQAIAPTMTFTFSPTAGNMIVIIMALDVLANIYPGVTSYNDNQGNFYNEDIGGVAGGAIQDGRVYLFFPTGPSLPPYVNGVFEFVVTLNNTGGVAPGQNATIQVFDILTPNVGTWEGTFSNFSQSSNPPTITSPATKKGITIAAIANHGAILSVNNPWTLVPMPYGAPSFSAACAYNLAGNYTAIFSITHPATLQWGGVIINIIDSSSGSGYGAGYGALVPVSNTYSGQYPNWQASTEWVAGDVILDGVTGGLYQANNTGTSAATQPDFNAVVGATTTEVSPGTVVWTCIATKGTGTPLRGAAFAIVYAGSLWLMNTWPFTTADELDGPCCIKMSDANNPESWNPANTAFLSRDDGDWITCGATFTIAESGIPPTGSLVVFKNFSTFQVTGVFGAPDLTIQQAQTNMGNIAAQSTQFIPGFGIMRLTHLGFAYFNGVSDQLTSESIRPYLFATDSAPDLNILDWRYAYLSKGSQSNTPPMYVCACPIITQVLTGVAISGGGQFLIYVFVLKLVQNAAGNWDEVSATGETQVGYATIAQVTVTTPAAANGVKYRIFAGYAAGAENQFIEAASFNGTYPLSGFAPGFTSYGLGGMTRLFCFDLVMKQWTVLDMPFAISDLRQIRLPNTIPATIAGGASDGALRRLFGGDLQWDTGENVVWEETGAEVFAQGGSVPLFYRRVVIRGSGNIGGNLTVLVTLEGVDQTPVTKKVKTLRGGMEWIVHVDIMKDALNANVSLSGAGSTQIVIDTVDWYVKPKSSGSPVSIQK